MADSHPERRVVVVLRSPEHLSSNKLLSALPSAVLYELWPSLEPIPLKARRVIHYARLPIEHVYFVERGLVAATAPGREGAYVQTWLIGPEGLVGVPI